MPREVCLGAWAGDTPLLCRSRARPVIGGDRVTLDHGLRVGDRPGDRFEITVRHHRLVVGRPTEAGGTDRSATPGELFVSGLASRVAFCVRRFLRRGGLSDRGLSVQAEFEVAKGPSGVGEVRLLIQVPDGVPAERRDALVAAAARCAVDNRLPRPPSVDIGLEAAQPGAERGTRSVPATASGQSGAGGLRLGTHGFVATE